MEMEGLLNKIQLLEKENEELKIKLKSYTAPTRSKSYYENHKEEIKEKVKDYKERTNYTYVVSPEKKKEYARIAYLNKKEKMKKEKSIQENIKA
jgi:phage protein D